MEKHPMKPFFALDFSSGKSRSPTAYMIVLSIEQIELTHY